MPLSIFSWREKRKQKRNSGQHSPRPTSTQDSGFGGSSISSSSSSLATNSSFNSPSTVSNTRWPIFSRGVDSSPPLATLHPRNQQQQQHSQNRQHHHHYTLSARCQPPPVRQHPFPTSSAASSTLTSSCWSNSAGSSPSSCSTYNPHHNGNSSRRSSVTASLSCGPFHPDSDAAAAVAAAARQYASPAVHPFLTSSTFSTSSSRLAPLPLVGRFKKAFARLLPRPQNKGRPKKATFLNSFSNNNKALFRSPLRSHSRATVTASSCSASSISSCSRTSSVIGPSMFHARSDPSSAIGGVTALAPSNLCCCGSQVQTALPTTPTTSNTAVLSPPCSPYSVHSINPLEVAAPACFPGTGREELASKHEQLLQLQQSSRRPSVLRAHQQQRSQPQSQQQQQHRVLPTSSTVSTTSTIPALMGGSGKRHLIPHHHHRGVVGLNPATAAIGVDCVCPNPNGVCSPLPLSSTAAASAAPFHLQHPNGSCNTAASWTTPLTNDRRSSISNRSIEEMEVISSSSSLSIHQLQRNTSRNSLTVHSASSSSLAHSSSSSIFTFDRQRRLSSHSVSAEASNTRSQAQQNLRRPSTTATATTTTLYPEDGGGNGDRKMSVTSSTSTTKSQLGTVERTTQSTTSTFGQGYDISTMFKVGPLPTSSPPTLVPTSLPLASSAMVM